jgi:signal transduction histidine kinase
MNSSGKMGESRSNNPSSETGATSFSEPAAGKLCAALLSDSLEKSQSLLRAALREDPAFFQWARTAAQPLDGSESPAEDFLTPWLAERLPEVLEHAEPGPGDFSQLLPGLARKMARLKTLQTDFTAAVRQEKLSAMAEFAAGAGHEINNPLTVIAGRAQLLLREETDPERRHALALMNTQAMRVYEMIADMMLFARPPLPHPVKVDVQQLLNDVVRQMQPAAQRQETALRYSLLPKEEKSVEITADPTQLMVALKALVQNSLEALGSGGHVEMELRASAADVEIFIRDDGPGIPAEVRPHVFEPFYSARQAGRGLGLGLCKAWRIITNHGGRISLESPPGPGALFSIILPQPKME